MTKETTIKDKELNDINGGASNANVSDFLYQNGVANAGISSKNTNSSVRHFQQIVSADVNRNENEN